MSKELAHAASCINISIDNQVNAANDSSGIKRKTGRPKKNGNDPKICIYIPERLRKIVKISAAAAGEDMSSYIISLITDDIEKNGLEYKKTVDDLYN